MATHAHKANNQYLACHFVATKRSRLEISSYIIAPSGHASHPRSSVTEVSCTLWLSFMEPKHRHATPGHIVQRLQRPVTSTSTSGSISVTNGRPL